MIVGQDHLVNRLLLALLCDGHVLLEGIPGVEKTLTVTCLAQSLRAQLFGAIRSAHCIKCLCGLRGMARRNG